MRGAGTLTAPGVGAAGWGGGGAAGWLLWRCGDSSAPSHSGAYPPVHPSVRPQLQNQSELRAPTAEKAALYLDAALAAREDSRGGSHVLFTLHVYQYRVEKCGRGGSRWPRA